VDPSGLADKAPPAAPAPAVQDTRVEGYRYYDELLGSHAATAGILAARPKADKRTDAEKKLHSDSAKFVQQVVKLQKKKDLTIKAHYLITGDQPETSGPTLFAQYAVKNCKSPNQLSMYFGHGAAEEGNKVNRDVVDDVKKALGTEGYNGLITFTCCYGGSFNELINPANRLPDSFKSKEESDNAQHLDFWSKNFEPVVVKKIDELLKKGKVELHLFFSQDKKLETKAEKDAWEKYTKDLKGPFYYANWSKLPGISP
jgi:hypothetical protein